MVKSYWMVGCIASVLGLVFASLAQATEATPQPNIVVILTDDLGWSDLGCYGADLIETPNLDRFAAEGIRFSQAYAMSVCSPTRAMLMTGKHAARLGITIWIEGSLQRNTTRPLLDATSRHDLPRTEITLATRLRKAGYLTASIGKWHLGDANHFPEAHGFDVNVGGTHWGAPDTYWFPYHGTGRFTSEYRYVPHLEYGGRGEYLTDRLTDEAIKFIDHAGNKPFFLYLAHHAPHTPIQAKPEDTEYFEAKRKPEYVHQNAVYAAMIKSIDESVGRVLAQLRTRGLEENTIVIFTSDNGGYIGTDRKSGQSIPVTSNAPLRSGKGSLYEGGIRVPLLIRWPKVAKVNGRCDEPVSLADLFPTLMAAVEPAPSKLESERPICDGVDIKSLIEAPSGHLQRDTLYFHYPHYYDTTTPVSAIRQGDWKLLEYLEDGRRELYDLRADPFEKRDQASQAPDRVVDLSQRLEAWRKEVHAQMPKQNPAWSPIVPSN